MAAMYPLFLCLLFTAVCSIVGIIHHPVNKMEYTSLFGETPSAAEASSVDRQGRDALWEERYRESIRYRIIRIAEDELGVREATGNNDGVRVEEYLAYTGLGKGHAWCAAFVSWCYGQAGLSEPRNPWSPALLPKSKTYCSGSSACLPSATARTVSPADIFGIYSISAKRINHVGLIKAQEGKYLVTIEGNVTDKVLSKRRHISAVHAIADWVLDEL